MKTKQTIPGVPEMVFVPPTHPTISGEVVKVERACIRAKKEVFDKEVVEPLLSKFMEAAKQPREGQESTMMTEQIRYSDDASVSMVWDAEADEPVRFPTQEDMDTLPVGDNLTADDLARCEE